MKWPAFTTELIAGFDCAPDKYQSIYWDGACPGLGVRVTPSGHKSFVFDSRLRRDSRRIKVRITLGDVRSWGIAEARRQARRYKVMTDQGIDPRYAITADGPGAR